MAPCWILLIVAVSTAMTTRSSPQPPPPPCRLCEIDSLDYAWGRFTNEETSCPLGYGSCELTYDHQQVAKCDVIYNQYCLALSGKNLTLRLAAEWCNACLGHGTFLEIHGEDSFRASCLFCAQMINLF